MQQGFVDLRANADSTTGNESFWPSFTDIMTVVVMIFLLASTILILRNWELVAELRASIEAERQAAALAQSTTEVNVTLQEQLVQAQHQISLMRMQLMQAREDDQLNRQRLAEREQELLQQRNQYQQLEDRLAAAHRQYRALDERFKQLGTEFEASQQAYTQQETRLNATLQELATLETSHQEQTAELVRLRQQSAQSEQRLSVLQDEFDVLKVKYDKLVQPARTAKGKHVVEVRYVKRGGRYRISMKEPGQATHKPLNRKQLERRLTQLKKRHAKRLYIKIIIPENSGLSYNEAWDFTKKILEKYDYYHQS